MEFEKELRERSGNQCELCAGKEGLTSFEVKPTSNRGGDEYVMVCGSCNEQLNNPDAVDANHWRCLNDSMWSEVDAVKVVAWRMLNQLSGEGWPQDLLDMMFLEDDVMSWAKAGVVDAENAVVHRDSNGAILQTGDNVVLIKDLDVKGGNFTAKRGTAVRGISLDMDNPEYIEGKVNGQHIVILTKYVKK